jgi:predicted transcriptional regulator
MKGVISERLPAMKEEIQRQVKEWQEKVKTMREKEFSLSNFITPENYWGFSTLVR